MGQLICGAEKPVIAMIHVDALPGTPRHTKSIEQIKDRALRDAEIYLNEGVNILMLENMHDIPYMKNSVGPEITASMAIIGASVKKEFQVPCGIQILAGANREALACAYAAGFDFIRAEGFVFGHLADEGYIDACAGELLRYRKQIGAETIKIFTDIKKKHSSHAVSVDVSIVETASAAEFFLSDGLIITGQATAKEAQKEEIIQIRNTTQLPVLVGSGVNIDNLHEFLPLVDGMIVGSAFKEKGLWSQPVSSCRVRKFMDKYRLLMNSG